VRDKCEFLQICGFFRHYRADAGVRAATWVRMYCENVDKSKTCERKQVLAQTGSPPPDNMAPTGQML